MAVIITQNLSKLLVKVIFNNGLSMALTFAYYTLVSRILVDGGYGTFFYNISLILVAVMLSELGINISLQKQANENKWYRGRKNTFGNALFIKIIIALCVSSFLLYLDFINSDFYYVYFFGLCLNIFYNHLLTYFQAVRSEETYLSAVIFGGVLRMIVLLGLWYFKLAGINSIITAFFVPQAFVVLWLFRSSKDTLSKQNRTTVEGIIFNNLSLHLLTLVVAVLVRMEFFILEKYGSAEDLDLFSLFFTYSMLIPPLIAALNSTLIVRISSFESFRAYNSYVKKLTLILTSLMLLLGVLIAFFLSYFLAMTNLNLFYFFTVYIAILSTLIVKPWGLLLHYYNMERTILTINGLQTLIGFGIGIFLYKLLGLLGIVVSFALQQIVANIFILILATSAARDNFIKCNI